MRYIRKEDVKRTAINLDSCGSIHVSGSVRGMQSLYGWPEGGQVRVGEWIYNIGPHEVERLRARGFVHGESQ